MTVVKKFFLGKPVTVNLKPNETETICNYIKYNSVLHHNRVKIGSVILATKSYSQFNRRNNSFIKFRSHGTTKYARILTFFSCINDNMTLVNIFQIQNSSMDNCRDRSSVEQFPSLKLLATPNHIVYGTFSNLAIININLSIAPVIGMVEKEGYYYLLDLTNRNDGS